MNTSQMPGSYRRKTIFGNPSSILRCFVIGLFLAAVGGESHGQYVHNYFGTNKVQYTDFSWQILETEHFDIFYYPEMRELAERAAGMAEEQYLELQARFNYSLTRRVPIIIYSSHLHFQQTNVTPFELPEGVAGFFEFLKGRVVLPSNGSVNQFRRVLRHELVHVFMNAKFDRILLNHRKYNHPGLPLWFTEGLAEIWSGTPDPQGEMLIRDAVINNYILPVDDFYRVSGSYFMYKMGENFLNFVVEEYGPEKILLIIENSWKSAKFSRTLENALGKDTKTLGKEWVYHLKKKYYPKLEDQDIPSAVSQEVTKDGYNIFPVYFKRGAIDEFYYVANRNGYTNIYRQNLKTRESEVVIKGERSDEFEKFHFFTSKIDINKNGQLAFVAKSGEKDILYIYDVFKKEVVKSYGFRDIVGIASPDWSPAGDGLVFSGLSFGGKSDLYVLTVSAGKDDGALRQINNDFYDDRHPTWSPDGRYVAYSSDRGYYGQHGNYNLFLYDLVDRQHYYLTWGDYSDAAPAWSKDGQYLAFTSTKSGASGDIWAIAFPDGVGAYVDRIRQSPGHKKIQEEYLPHKITNLTSAAYGPTWTDQDEILFTAFENFLFKIRKIDNVESLVQKPSVLSREEDSFVKSSWDVPRVFVKDGNSREYEKKYALDIVQGAFQADPIYGSGGGAQLAYTDLLGNEHYYLTLFNNTRTTGNLLTSWNFVLTKANLTQRANFAYGLFRFKGEYVVIDDAGGLDFIDQNRVGGFFQVSYPLSRFHRVDATLNLSSYKRERGINLNPVDGILTSNFIGYTFDNALWGPTGPIDGRRMSFSVGYTTDIQNSSQNYYTYVADYRRYLRITNRSAFAVRAMTQWNHGKNPGTFLLGGSWDLRGYPRWNMPGTRFVVLNSELRFPLLNAVNVQFPFTGIGLRSIRGAVFMDIGNAWGTLSSNGIHINEDNRFDGFVGSVGTGFRINLLRILVLRFDFGKLFDARGYKLFNAFRLPGDQERFIETRITDSGIHGFGGRTPNGKLRKGRWSDGVFFQFWFGVDY